MSNLTLVIDDDVLRRARHRALEEGTSVNAVVREMIAAYSRGGREDNTMIRRLTEHARVSRAASGTDGRSWSREDVYDRGRT